MTEVLLKRPRVLSVIGEFEAAGVSQHVRMDREGHLGRLAKPAYHAPKPDGTGGSPAFTHEYVPPRFLFPLQSAERPKLGARKGMH